MLFSSKPMPGPRGFGRSQRLLHWFALAVCLTAAAIAGISACAAAGESSATTQLLMVEASGCRFCALWHKEIGPAYAQSAEGKFAPLVRVARDSPQLSGLKAVTFTPTFIVVQNGVEMGRLAGYPGRDYFWDELNLLLRPVGFAPAPPAKDDKL